MSLLKWEWNTLIGEVHWKHIRQQSCPVEVNLRTFSDPAVTLWWWWWWWCHHTDCTHQLPAAQDVSVTLLHSQSRAKRFVLNDCNNNAAKLSHDFHSVRDPQSEYMPYFICPFKRLYYLPSVLFSQSKVLIFQTYPQILMINVFIQIHYQQILDRRLLCLFDQKYSKNINIVNYY